jgi:glycosyltransferase involved in cell wall biosynthesis
MTLTIGYDATAAVTQTAGIGRYVRELLGAFGRRDDDFRFRMFQCGSGRGTLPDLDGRFHLRKVPVSDRLMNAIWQRARLPLPVQALTGAIDVFHSPDFTLPPTMRTPSVLTVHDLAFLTVPDCAFPTLRAYLERVVPRSVEIATRVIAVSHSTAGDLQRLLNVPEARIVTIAEGVGKEFQPIADPRPAHARLREMGLEGSYILAVGTLEPRKNYVRLLEAYALLRDRGATERLVIAGRRGWLYEPVFERLSELRLEEHVTMLSPTDADLPMLYGMCSLFVFPSLYEGFGIPPLEALACGAVVACSNASSMPEVVGDAAVMFDPTDVAEMVEVMQRALRDEALRERLSGLGPRHAARFTWDGAAERTASVYREVAAGA